MKVPAVSGRRLHAWVGMVAAAAVVLTTATSAFALPAQHVRHDLDDMRVHNMLLARQVEVNRTIEVELNTRVAETHHDLDDLNTVVITERFLRNRLIEIELRLNVMHPVREVVVRVDHRLATVVSRRRLVIVRILSGDRDDAIVLRARQPSSMMGHVLRTMSVR